jgi:hypothetical protein
VYLDLRRHVVAGIGTGDGRVSVRATVVPFHDAGPDAAHCEGGGTGTGTTSTTTTPSP